MLPVTERYKDTVAVEEPFHGIHKLIHSLHFYSSPPGGHFCPKKFHQLIHTTYLLLLIAVFPLTSYATSVRREASEVLGVIFLSHRDDLPRNAVWIYHIFRFGCFLKPANMSSLYRPSISKTRIAIAALRERSQRSFYYYCPLFKMLRTYGKRGYIKLCGSDFRYYFVYRCVPCKCQPSLSSRPWLFYSRNPPEHLVATTHSVKWSKFCDAIHVPLEQSSFVDSLSFFSATTSPFADASLRPLPWYF